MNGKLPSIVTSVRRHRLHYSFPPLNFMHLFLKQPSPVEKQGVSSAEITKVADWSRESTFIKFYHSPKILLLEERLYRQPNPVVICILMRLAGWCPVLHEAVFRTVQRLGTNLQYSTNSAICRMGTSPPTLTQFITAILLLPVPIFLLSLSFFPPFRSKGCYRLLPKVSA